VGEMREPLATVFPGDPSLTALTEEEAEELAAEEAELLIADEGIAEESRARMEALAAPEFGEDGPEAIDPFELPGEGV
jgi:hypothetical protein